MLQGHELEKAIVTIAIQTIIDPCLVRVLNSNHIATIFREEDWQLLHDGSLRMKGDKMSAHLIIAHVQ